MRAQDPGDGSPGRDADEGATETEAPSKASRSLPGLPATLLGWLVAPSTPGSLFVDFPGNVLGPVAARSTLVLDEAMVTRAVAIRQPAILVFENGEAGRPIVLGLLQAPPSPLEGLLLGPPPAPLAKSGTPQGRPVEARVDGRRVTISADEEITLKCGEAAITLRRDGKILLRGAYVETYARGTNRIKGAQVKIN
jgi:Domain of unknown function (DUF6484)